VTRLPGAWTAGFARVPDGPRVDGCSAPAHRLTTPPWTILWLAHSRWITAARRVTPLNRRLPTLTTAPTTTTY